MGARVKQNGMWAEERDKSDEVRAVRNRLT